MRAWLLVLAACGGGSGGPPVDNTELVGRPCDLGNVQTDETVIASPSLDCESRLCLHAAGASISMCSAECDPEECNEAPESACDAGFVCAPVVSLGPFACHAVCVCADHVPVTTCN